MDLVENVGRRSRVGGDQGDFINVGIFSVNGYERNALFHNLGPEGSKFIDVAYPARADAIEDGRGLGLLDIDGDGDLDLVINNYLQPARLFINHAPRENHWLRLKLEGTRSNRSAIGARAVVQHGARRQVREVISAAGYLSGQSLFLHFGLGGDARVDRLTIHWPAGGVTEIEGLPADDFYLIREGDPAAVPMGRLARRTTRPE
jgi:hypothetical protein